MKIVLLTVQVPFIRGGAEVLADQLKAQLMLRGHQVETVAIPFRWYPHQNLNEAILMGQMIDVSEAAYEKVDLAIGLKFPAYYGRHPRRVLWLLHQHRQAYDLYGTNYSDMHQSAEGEKLRDLIVATDTTMLSKYETRYTISQNVSNRLMKHNQLASDALYHPPEDSDKLRCEAYENFIFYPSRIDFMKRQRLLVDAARFLKSDIKIKIAGTGSGEELKYLQEMIKTHQLDHRVELLGHISQEQKIDLLSRCRAVFFGCYDEDYGYVTLESMFSRKLVIAFTDAGGPTEFINDNVNGFIVPVDAKRLATTIDQLSFDQALAEKMGSKAYQSMSEKNVSWENVVSRLLMVT